MEQGAVIHYQRRKGKTYMEYKHPDKIIDVKYEKNRKTGAKLRHLIYKTCYAGLVTEGLPIADETKSIPQNPNVTEIGNGKHKDKDKDVISAPIAIAQVTTIARAETELDYKQLYLDARTEIEEYKNVIGMLISNHAKSVREVITK
jgi:hypothetical protein